jgi:hypothetical protein
LRVVLDHWACQNGYYVQANKILKGDSTVLQKWLPHYALLPGYPLKTILAEGTHGDISLKSREQTHGIAQKIIETESQSYTLVNATFKMFCDKVDSTESSTPFLQPIKGEFGHSWELWPTALAKYAMEVRLQERMLLSIEALAATTGFGEDYHQRHQKAQWLLAMLADHAWNGAGPENIIQNANIRKSFVTELKNLNDEMLQTTWKQAGLTNSTNTVTVFNPISIPRADLVQVELPDESHKITVKHDGRSIPCQILTNAGKSELYFISEKSPVSVLTPMIFSRMIPDPCKTAF